MNASVKDRLSAKQAGYMELRGAQKDGDCNIVAVQGGISLGLGCCNEFEPQNRNVERFRCGDCEHHIEQRRSLFYGG